MPALVHAHPAVHGRHAPATVALVASLKVPAAHSVGADDPDPQYAPEGHGRHWSALVRFSSLEYVPAAHGCVCAAPVPPGQTYPRGQFCGDPLPFLHQLPAGHSTQASASTEPVSGL